MASLMDDIVIDETMYNAAVNEIGDIAVEELKNVLDTNLYKVKLSAYEFLAAYNNYQIQLENYINNLQHQKQLTQLVKNANPNGLDTVVNQYAQNKHQLTTETVTIQSIGEEIYAAMFKFQNIINTYLEQEEELIFVFQDDEGNPILYRLTDPTQFLTYELNKNSKKQINGARGRFRITQEQLKSGIQQYATDTLDQDGLANLQATYKEAIIRFDKYHDRSKRIMWINVTPPPKYNVMRVVTKGDISEAYASVVLARQEFIFSGMTEVDPMGLELFMKNYVQYVDNAAGSLQGDVEVGNTEYAIKAARSQTPGLEQFKNICDAILEDSFSKEKMQQIKQDQNTRASLRNKMIKGSTQIAEQYLSPIIRSVIKS